VLRLGEGRPSEDSRCPRPPAPTDLVLPAIHRLGIWPDAAIRSDCTPADYAGARVGAAVRDPGAWGGTLHVFHRESARFAEVLT